MKLILQLIFILVSILSISKITIGQNDFSGAYRFGNGGKELPKEITYSPSSLYYASTFFNKQFFGLSDDAYIQFGFDDIPLFIGDPVGSTNTADSGLFSQTKEIVFGSAVTTTQRIYAMGAQTINRIQAGNTTSEQLTFENGNSYFGIETNDGGISFGDKVFFLASKSNTPDSSVLLFIQEDINFFNSSSVSEIPLNAAINLPMSIAMDSTLGLAFIGDSDGDILLFDLTSSNQVVYQNTSIPHKRTTAIVDSTRKRLYSCGSPSVDGSIVYVDVFSYDATSLTLIHSFSIDGQMCTSATMDLIGGQLFFSVVSGSGSQLIGTDVNGENQGFLMEPMADTDSIATYVDPNTLRVTIFYGTSMFTTEYASICPFNCSGVGLCEYGTCVCGPNYVGQGCENELCLHLNNCSSNGECQNGDCFCNSFYTGLMCDERRCENDCNKNGICNVTANYTCECNEAFTGTTCNETVPPPPCEYYTDSDGCLSRTTCGWCEVDGVCMNGDRYGPFDGFCRTWFFESNVETGVIALAIIFIACIGILYLIDIGTTIPIDLQRAKDYAEEYKSGQHPKATHEQASILWWRDQRSAKAWSLMDQFQFISLVSHIGVVFPSRFISFTEYLDWSNLGIPFPPSISPPQTWSIPSDWTASTRTILSMSQYENSLGSGDLYLLANILFWFGLLIGVFLIPLLLVLAVVSLMEKLVHWKEVVTNRIIHITVRILGFGYIGVLLAASFAMVAPINDYRVIIPGAIIFVLYGIGLPVAIWFILAVPEARLHNPTFKQQFGCLYVHFKPKTDHRFVVFAFVKRFIMAVIVGILAFKPMPNYPLTGTDLAVPIVQVIVIDIALIGYIVLLAIRKPYFDHYQLWLEYLLAGINIVTVSLSLTHIKSPSAAGELIACLIQAIALIACIAAYIISWLQMRSAFLQKVKKFFCCCCKGMGKNSKEVKLDKA